MRILCAIVLALVAMAHADMYLHNPRGANNRLDEANRERNNANRLYDSQNNNRGGYNVGSLYYYEGSILSIEWTNQHSCGDQNNYCEQILQYMCDDNARDGASTNTIPDNPAQCDNFDCNTDLEFGMHETFDYYVNCRLRQRNMGLFTADRNLRGSTARYTRQNQNGNRYGYECNEERDYYPYWHPTPWRDIAVYTNEPGRCSYYQRESQNVKSRFACILPDGLLIQNFYTNNPVIPITKEECEGTVYEQTGETGVWTEFPPDPRLSAPECVESQWSRDNHLGNSVGGFPLYHNWTIPNIPHEHCVLRIRYNISTADYDAWDPSVNSSLRRVAETVYDGDTNNMRRVAISELDVASQFDLDQEESFSRGYVYRQNPVVKVFPDLPQGGNNFGLQLAINTNQFGRTFQDRSHTFAIRERPAELEDATIYNLNVRGKRGNIVQVYPGVEYDFVPNSLVASLDSYVHIQWTGSNTNPNNNDGQGQRGSDRSNVVLLTSQNYDEGVPPLAAKFGHWGNSYPANLDSEETFLGLSREDRQALATLNNLQLGGEMSELDDAGTYFDLGPRKITKAGLYYYLCTRNNNFTNRSQKGLITVQENAYTQRRLGVNGGDVLINDHRLLIESGDLAGPVVFTMEEYRNSSSALLRARELTNVDPEQFNPPPDSVSSYLLILPVDQFTADGREVEIDIDLGTSTPPRATSIYRANARSGWTFERLETEVEDGRAVASTSEGGLFVAASPQDTALIAGLSVMGVFLLIIALSAAGVVVFFIVRREKWNSLKESTRKAKVRFTRSFAKEV